MFASYFKVRHDSSHDVVYLSVKDTEHSVTEHQMSLAEWHELVAKHRDGNSKSIRISIPISDTAKRFYDVPSREFMLLVAEYDSAEEKDTE